MGFDNVLNASVLIAAQNAFRIQNHLVLIGRRDAQVYFNINYENALLALITMRAKTLSHLN